MSSIEYTAVVTAIQQVTSSGCSTAKQTVLKQIQEWELLPGFSMTLVRFLETPQTYQLEERQFVAILLKNVVLRIIQTEELRARHDEEILAVKEFLLRSFGETQHQVFFQLHSLIAKLARTYWPNYWPELIPTILSIIGNEQQFLHSFEATCCLHEVMVELTTKASCCGTFYRIYYELCLQLFQPIAKLWAIRMKSIQSYLANYANRINEELDDGSFFGTRQFIDQPRYFRDEGQETSVFYAIVMAKVLKMIIETAFVDILKRFPCFTCLWKTYMGSIQIGASFIRKIRPHFSRLTAHLKNEKQKKSTRYSKTEVRSEEALFACSCGVSIGVLERFHALDIDDFNYSGDFYFDIRDYSEYLNDSYRGFINIINLSMKFIKVLNCLPIHLQKKYPVEAIPLLEQLVQFYYKFQIDEVSTDLIQNMVLTILPLTSVTFASQLVLSNIITCSAYNDFNRYRNVTNSSYTPSHLKQNHSSFSSGNAVEVAMDEAVIEANVTAAHDFIRDFFNEIRVKELLERQLVFCFHYTPQALELWEKDPERFFINEEYVEGMELEYLYVRNSAEKLFVALLEVKPQVVVDIVLSLLRDVKRQSQITSSLLGNEANNAEILLWDSIYTAAGLGVEKIAESLGVSPTEWLLQILGPLLNNLLKSEKCGSLFPCGQQVLRARILKLISSWVSQFDTSVHAMILEFLVNLLSYSSNSDVVVLLSTVKCLAALINLKNFQHQSLLPVALPCVQSLLCFYQRSLQESETKLMVLSLVKDIIQLIGVQITGPGHRAATDLVVQLSSCLFSLWSTEDNNDIIRGSVVEVFTVFVQSMKETCTLSCNSQEVSLVEVLLSIALSACQKTIPATNCSPMYKETVQSIGSVQTVLESLLLFECIVRNINGDRCISKYPNLIHKFTEILQFMNSSLLSLMSGEVNMQSKYESEANLKTFLDRICNFLTGTVLVFASQLPLLPELLLQIQLFYSNIVSNFPPQLMEPVLESLERLLIIAPDQMSEILFQARAVSLAINICCSHASCPNLAGLMKSFHVNQEVLLSATKVLNLLILSAPEVLMKGLQIVKEEILSFLLRATGVSNTNLSETIILNELVCVILKCAHRIKSSSGTTVSGIYLLRVYCLSLWSFVSPNHPTRTEAIIPQFFPLESVKPWLKDFFELLKDYASLCDEFFSSHRLEVEGNETEGIDWKLDCYNNHFSCLFPGHFSSTELSEADAKRLFQVYQEEISPADGHLKMDPLQRLLYNLQLTEQRFASFHREVSSLTTESRIQHIDEQNEIVERDDNANSQFMIHLLHHRIYRISLPGYIQERGSFIESNSGRGFCLHMISSYL